MEVKTQYQKAQTLRILLQTRIWELISILVYTILVFALWNMLQQTLSWCKQRVVIFQLPYSLSFELSSLYALVLLLVALALLSVASAVVVMVPATVVAWITIVVLLSFIGKSRRVLVAEGRRITREIIVGFVVKVFLKEGNVLAAVFAVFGYFAVITMNYY